MNSIALRVDSLSQTLEQVGEEVSVSSCRQYRNLLSYYCKFINFAGEKTEQHSVSCTTHDFLLTRGVNDRILYRIIGYCILLC